MTQNEIMAAVHRDYDEFNKSPYSGNPALPKDIMERFKVAVFTVSPEVQKIPTDVVKKILAKKLKDLNNVDVPTILNAISRASFKDLYKDFDEALEKNIEIESLKISFNLTVKHITEQMEVKKNNLMALTGQGNGKIKSMAQA